MRIGIGYDIHPLKKGYRLVLGGVEIPSDRGLVGHSDGDVVLHAIVDAALGALGEGDIGTLFPDNDPRWKGVQSLTFVKTVRSLLKKKKLAVAHVDSTVVAETPKLSPFRMKIRKKISDSLGVPLGSVGFKAKTNEGFGAIGKCRAMACFSVVSLKEIGRKG